MRAPATTQRGRIDAGGIVRRRHLHERDDVVAHRVVEHDHGSGRHVRDVLHERHDEHDGLDRRHDRSTGDTTGSTGGSTGPDSASSSSTIAESSTTDADPCDAQDVGNAVPVAVLLDNTGAGDEFDPSCASGTGGQDLVLAFTAPADGGYEFTTRRDATVVTDTVLSVFDGTCEGAELGCHDDWDFFTDRRSVVTATLAAGQTVAVVVDGLNATFVGAIELYIEAVPAPGPGGTCCSSDAGVGGCDATDASAATVASVRRPSARRLRALPRSRCRRA